MNNKIMNNNNTSNVEEYNEVPIWDYTYQAECTYFLATFCEWFKLKLLSEYIHVYVCF